MDGVDVLFLRSHAFPVEDDLSVHLDLEENETGTETYQALGPGAGVHRMEAALTTYDRREMELVLLTTGNRTKLKGTVAESGKATE